MRNKEQLLAFLRQRATSNEGYASWRDVHDSYPQVATDLKALKRDGLIMSLYSSALDSKSDGLLDCDVYYPVDQAFAGFQVHEDVQLLWQMIQVPEDEDEVQDELKKLKLKPSTRKAPRKREKGERKKKARKPPRLRVVTNAHLMELLLDTTADRID